ncbi:hypothetical protein YDYSG_40640 [Paenibacillus tyrfis]|nr:hypothetical protein YDYSG_40640 [Paenibacillus tyrfis]
MSASRSFRKRTGFRKQSAGSDSFCGRLPVNKYVLCDFDNVAISYFFLSSNCNFIAASIMLL